MTDIYYRDKTTSVSESKGKKQRLTYADMPE